ncbi:MAG TPA: cytochrome c-type biogenesis CcmF C-terminal domain-containing protein [Vicinamibacterales bacterium]|nr:cytochrome c-type biogenesis CcmF C-terminal domain-containing protein [Vicinamibacterales bacterium]
MASLGAFILVLTFVAAAYAAGASVAGARRRNNRLIESGIGAFYLVAALLAVASGIIIYAFVAGDFSIKYVQRYSDSVQPLFYKITSYWGGLDGSVMFWVFLLSVFGSVAVKVNRERHRELIPYVVAVTAVVEMFFLFLMIVHNNPFETYLTESPTEGRGLNPLLQNFYMAIHPPTMYLGFVGLTIPFAFGMAALITGHLDDSWLRAVRRWTMFSWFFLSFGLTLGMIWAYEELGWGGFWGWDPVENAGLLPWFTATAFLHSVMVQERRGMLRVWNVSLVILTFLLTIFGTFMTRSGIVQSVHAFGEDPELARMFLTFMAGITLFSFGWVIYRLPMLKARNELESWASREGAFLANNWALLFGAFFVLFATMYPTITEAISGERLSVGPSFFNKWMTPVGLILLFLTGVGPLLAWRKSSLPNLAQQFLWPAVSALVVGGVVVALGVRVWSSGICFALCGFVFGTISQEYIRGANVRRATSGADLLTAMVGLVGRNKRRYGGYIVHVGIVLMFLGFAGEGFSRDEQLLVRPGQEATVGDYTLRMDALRVTEDNQKQMITAHITVKDADGQEIGKMYPAKWYFARHEEEPTTEVAIRRSFAEDLYIVMPAFEVKEQSASIEVHINPLINWIWLGFAVLALGTAIALLPESAFTFAMAKLPAEAATAAFLLFTLLGVPAVVAAQHMETPMTGGVVVRSPAEKSATDKLACWCGGCSKLQVGSCSCGHCAIVRKEVTTMLASGKSEDQVLQHYVAQNGGMHVLTEPPTMTFRLSYLVPYGMGMAGLLVAGFVAVRWSRRSDAAEASAARNSAPSEDATLATRLDDELRDLD